MAFSPSFAPDPSNLTALVQLLSDFRHPGADQAAVYARLVACEAVPDFNSYLAHLLTQSAARNGGQAASLFFTTPSRSRWRFAKAPACC